MRTPADILATGAAWITETEQAALVARITELEAEITQVTKWSDGLVTETQRLQKIEERAEKAEAEVERLNSILGKCADFNLATRVVELEAEVARLKGYMRPDQIEEAETVKGLLAEVELERQQRKAEEGRADQYMAEVERLRIQVREQLRGVDDLRTKAVLSNDEVVRLTDALCGTVAQVEQQRKRAEQAEAKLAEADASADRRVAKAGEQALAVYREGKVWGNFTPGFDETLRTLADEVSTERAKLAEAEAQIDALYSEEPCPKCGSGVTAECYGCKLKELEAKLARVVEAIVALREESKALPIPEAIPEGHKERLLVLRAHISDVAALAAAKEKP